MADAPDFFAGRPVATGRIFCGRGGRLQNRHCAVPGIFQWPADGAFNQRNTAEAVRQLAEFTEPLREAIVQMAVAYNVNIIAGSMPEYGGGVLYNAAYLCRRDGTWDTQPKLHITPDERAYWGLQGGDSLRVFELDVGKIGILVCYDVEFPELPRLLADQGMQILFVPFWTDTKNAYLRVRRCAQARAIENECYVVISGSVGNLPKVENMDMQYAQAAVFTPSDFAFPHDAIAAEATPNTEMTLIVDLDLDNLKEMRMHGSVRNFRDRRLDLYKIAWTGRELSNLWRHSFPPFRFSPSREKGVDSHETTVHQDARTRQRFRGD
jgi:predicted amidohydrolase